MSECRSILMVGTHPQTMGGISTVVRGYREAGLFERFDCTYVVTHRDGSALVKVLAALSGWLGVCIALTRLKAPLVHIHLSSRACFWRKSVVCLMAMAARRPYLLHVHGSEFMQFYDAESGPLTKRFVRFIFRHSALVLALSEQWRVNILRICPMAKVEVLPNAVSLPIIEGTRRNAGDASMIILFLGRLGQRKGTFDLVRAHACVVRRFPATRLTCAGDGAIEDILALAGDLGTRDRVDCPGWLNPEETRRALSAATLFVLPSHAEGLPMALLEAMSWGLPVVASPVGGIPQVLRDDDNGLIVAPGDVDGLVRALCRLIEDAPTRERLGTAARKTIEQSFSLEASLERLSQTYRRFGVPMLAGSVAEQRSTALQGGRHA